MNLKHYLKSYFLFLAGLFVASMGVAFSTKAGLGTSPVASVPYSISLLSEALTFGGWLNLWSVLQILVQVFLPVMSFMNGFFSTLKRQERTLKGF